MYILMQQCSKVNKWNINSHILIYTNFFTVTTQITQRLEILCMQMSGHIQSVVDVVEVSSFFLPEWWHMEAYPKIGCQVS